MEFIAEVVPTVNNRAVEMFVKAVDVPLVSIGQRVSLTFDGFPAINATSFLFTTLIVLS